MMSHEWQELYDFMQRDILLCQQKGLDKRTEIECCFQIANNYTARLEKDISSYCFMSEREEVEFYKEIKPMFRSLVRYFNYLYHAELFRPNDNVDKVILFWNREAQRMEKFIGDNQKFFEYIKSGKIEKDKEYFLMSEKSKEETQTKRYDELIAKLLALEKYQEHIQNELSCLRHG